MTAKRHAICVDRVEVGEAHHLETTTVGEERRIERHEAVQTTGFRNEIDARAQVEMIGVGQRDPRTECFEIFAAERLHRATRTDRHEGRCRDIPMAGVQDAPPRTPIPRHQLVPDPRHGVPPSPP
jgi:hypothetical protein